MTPEQLRKIDALVAEHVMGAIVKEYEGRKCWRYDTGLDKMAVPQKDYIPTEDISQAWEVVEALRKQDIMMVIVSREDGSYSCRYHLDAPDHHQYLGYASAPTAPLAICLAALKVNGVDIDQFI